VNLNTIVKQYLRALLIFYDSLIQSASTHRKTQCQWINILNKKGVNRFVVSQL